MTYAIILIGWRNTVLAVTVFLQPRALCPWALSKSKGQETAEVCPLCWGSSMKALCCALKRQAACLSASSIRSAEEAINMLKTGYCTWSAGPGSAMIWSSWPVCCINKEAVFPGSGTLQANHCNSNIDITHNVLLFLIFSVREWPVRPQ